MERLTQLADAAIRPDALTPATLADLAALGSEARDSNHVAVHISGIRRELGRHASLIETVRGIGYRLRWRASSMSP